MKKWKSGDMAWIFWRDETIAKVQLVKKHGVTPENWIVENFIFITVRCEEDLWTEQEAMVLRLQGVEVA